MASLHDTNRNNQPLLQLMMLVVHSDNCHVDIYNWCISWLTAVKLHNSISYIQWHNELQTT